MGVFKIKLISLKSLTNGSYILVFPVANSLSVGTYQNIASANIYNSLISLSKFNSTNSTPYSSKIALASINALLLAGDTSHKSNSFK